MRTIDADELKEKVALMWGDNNHITESMYEIIDNAPTINKCDNCDLMLIAKSRGKEE
jgi:hypothetical protein